MTSTDAHAPVVVDLFAGCGGLSLGFQQAGFHVIAYERWSTAVQTHERNLNGEAYERDIDENLILPHHDVLIGGPPCQPFSVTGRQKGKKDERDMIPVFLELAKKYNPKLVMMENVANLASKRHQGYLESTLLKLESFGYSVQYKVLNAVDFGVPQNRRRLFIVGSRVPFSFPQGKGSARITVGDVIPTAWDTIIPELTLTPNQDAYIARYEKKSQCINPRDLVPDKPARTITCRNLCGSTSDMIRIKLTNGTRRQLTVEEAASLHTFPPKYFEGVSRNMSMKMIGNAVPPELAKALALSCISAIFSRKTVTLKSRKRKSR